MTLKSTFTSQLEAAYWGVCLSLNRKQFHPSNMVRNQDNNTPTEASTTLDVIHSVIAFRSYVQSKLVSEIISEEEERESLSLGPQISTYCSQTAI